MNGIPFYRTLNQANPVNMNCRLNNSLVSWYLALPQSKGISGWGSPTLWDLQRFTNGGNNGALSGTTLPVWSPGPAGRPGGWGSLFYNGTTSFTDLGTPAGLSFTGLTNQLSIFAWIKTTGSAANYMVVNKGNSVSVQYALGLNSGTGTIRIQYGTVLFSGTKAVNDGNWHFIGFTAGTAAGSAIGYVDGIQDGSGGSISGTTVANNTYIGARADGALFFPGNIDDVRLWGRQLTAEEVIAVYNDSRTGYQSTLNWETPWKTFGKAAAVTGKLFRQNPLTGTGTGGPFFSDPMAA